MSLLTETTENFLIMALLDIQNLTIRFGGLTAVSNVDLQIEQGQIYSVIGPNGAGKTTVFNAITGIYEPTGGTILFDGRRLERRISWRVFLVLRTGGNYYRANCGRRNGEHRRLVARHRQTQLQLCYANVSSFCSVA